MVDNFFTDVDDFDHDFGEEHADHVGFFAFGSDFELEDWLVIGFLGRIAHNTSPRVRWPPDPQEDFRGYVRYILHKYGRELP